jgi:formylglycine-generating enzyme required for sulfatase activity
MVNLQEVAKLASVRPVSSPYRDTTWISGGTFHMGSNKHYPEEAPAHCVAVDGFWMDRTPPALHHLR